MTDTTQFRTKLVSVLTAYDQKQSKGKHWNPYALPQYIQAADEVMADIAKGADPRKAICARFVDRLLNAVLRGMGLTAPTNEECRGTGSLYYTPVSK